MSYDAFCLCYAALPVPGSIVITFCVFVTFPYGVLGQVWYFIVLIPDLCFTLYLDLKETCYYGEQVMNNYLNYTCHKTS